jgi:hypothetical protein
VRHPKIRADQRAESTEISGQNREDSKTCYGQMKMTIPILFFALMAASCIQSGPANDGSTSGDVTDARIIVSPSLSLGTDVAEVAAKAALAYLSGFPSPTSVDKKQAIQHGVKQGLDDARAKGRTITEADVAALEASVSRTVEKSRGR